MVLGFSRYVIFLELLFSLVKNKSGAKSGLATNFRLVAQKKKRETVIYTYQTDIKIGERLIKDVLLDTVFYDKNDAVEYKQDMELTVYWNEQKQKAFNYSELSFQMRDHIVSTIIGGLVLNLVLLALISAIIFGR